MKTLIVNFFGGPGTGKSTAAAGVFHELKLAGVNCEMALEYAKDKVWEGSGHILANQLYVFGKQYHRIWRLLEKVEIIVTDSPLLNSILYYQDENPHFSQMVAFEHKKLNNFNVLLGRVKPYNSSGRLQDEKAANALDGKIQGVLDKWREPYFGIPAARSSVDVITDMVFLRYKRLNEE